MRRTGPRIILQVILGNSDILLRTSKLFLLLRILNEQNKLTFAFENQRRRKSQYQRLILILSNKNIFTARKRSCGKVMFLHLSVILFKGGGVYLSMHWTGVVPQHAMGRSRLSREGCLPRRGCLGGNVHLSRPRGRHPQTQGQTPSPLPAMTIEAGGTHPTEMHSCVCE